MFSISKIPYLLMLKINAKNVPYKYVHVCIRGHTSSKLQTRSLKHRSNHQ